MLGKRIINTATGAAAACTTDTVQILDGTPFESIATYQLDGNATSIPNNTYPGTFTNPAYAAGQFGQAAVFDGSSSYIALPDNAFNFTTLTVSVWINVTTFNGEKWIFDGYDEIPNLGKGFGITTHTGDKVKFRAWGTGFAEVISNTVLSTNTWYNVTCVATQSEAKVYINGSLDNTGSLAGIEYLSTQNYGLGAVNITGTPVNHFTGKIDQVRIFNTALSAGAVTNLYNETVATASNSYINVPSCIAYYKMSDATDETGSYDGTASNVNFNVAGKFGNAGEFNGTTSIFNFPNAAYGASTTVFTVSGWFKHTSTANNREDIYFGNGATVGAKTGYALFTDYSSGNIALSFRDADQSQVFYISSSNIKDGSWYHLCLTYNNGAYVVYLNGASILNGTSPDFINNQTPSYNTYVGNRYGSTGSGASIIGAVDQIRIFNRAITSEEVETLYNEVQCVPTIVPTDYFNPVLYTGDNNSSKFIDVGFTPDLVWLKSRDVAASNALYDTVRGDNLRLVSNNTAAEDSVPNELVTGGFNIIGGTGYNDPTLGNQVAWCWKAGGPAVTNTDGTITSQVSANQAAGFSIVTWTGSFTTGPTIGHGLGQPPKIIMVRTLDRPSNLWYVSHPEDNTKSLILSSTAGQNSDLTWVKEADTFGADYTPTSFRWLAYCFAEVDGMSKIGSYIGTGAIGNTIVTGFRPRFLMTKRADIGGTDWHIWDSARNPSNPVDDVLFPNEPYAETDYSAFPNNFLSNGFSVDTTNGAFNADGGTYIFLAIAEEVFVPLTRNATDPFGDGSELALYKFEDNANDAEGNYDGVDTNVTYSAGYIDKAAVFNGSNNGIKVDSFSINAGSFTISLWVKANSGGNPVLRVKTNYNIPLSIQADGIYLPSADSTSYTRPDIAYDNGSWNHLVVTNSNVYLNGSNVHTFSGSVPTVFGSDITGLLLGNSAWNLSVPFTGSIDQVRIFNRALDSGEVEQLYNE